MRLTSPLRAIGLITALGGESLAPASLSARPPDRAYLVYVVSEAADKIALIRFGPQGARVERELVTGVMPADVDGPHGLAVSPDGRFYYVSLAHGQPFGSVWKYSTKDNSVVGRVTLGLFPASMQTTPDGDFLFVVNFNLHGDMVPSSVSVVATDEMQEIARIPTCAMPHGSRVNQQGTRQYSTCMMDDLLVEIDTGRLRVSRQFRLTGGSEGALGGTSAPVSGSVHAGQAPAGGRRSAAGPDGACSPTWAQPSPNGTAVYVACNGTSEIVEMSVGSWTLARRIPAGAGVYNLAVTKKGHLIATNKRGQSVSIFEIETGRELARLRTKRQVAHGVVVSPDDRYAFVSVEGVGAEPGTVEVIDLESLETVATVDVAPQAAGIDFWKIAEP